MVEMACGNPAFQTHPTYYSSSNPNPVPFPGKPAPSSNYRATNYLHSPYRLPHSLKGNAISCRSLTSTRVTAKPSSRKLLASTVASKPDGSRSSSLGSSMWSTPHAPRQKKPVVPHVATQAPVVVGVVGALHDGRSGRALVRKHPSTHSLLKRHSYLDGARFANVPTQVSLEKQTVCCRKEGSSLSHR